MSIAALEIAIAQSFALNNIAVHRNMLKHTLCTSLYEYNFKIWLHPSSNDQMGNKQNIAPLQIQRESHGSIHFMPAS